MGFMLKTGSLALAANTMFQLVVLGQVVSEYLVSVEISSLDVWTAPITVRAAQPRQPRTYTPSASSSTPTLPSKATSWAVIARGIAHTLLGMAT